MLRYLKISASLFVLLVSFGEFSADAQTAPGYKRTDDVVYGRKSGMALIMDVFQPTNANGYGVIFLVSGG